MLNKVFPLLSYLRYWLRQEDKYSLQSPSLFRTYRELFSYIKARNEEDLEIETFRKVLLSSDEVIEVEDFGAGSKSVNTAKRKVSDITKFSTSNRKYTQLYQFFCSLTPSQNVLELGTCMGISSRYLSKVTKGKVYSFEGSKEIARIAKPLEGFENLNLIVGELSQTLVPMLTKLDKIDFALIDATHTYEGTTTYFEQLLPKTHANSIIAIGDIHWSREMEKAWDDIKNKSEVKLSLDFYECGIVFFDYPGEKAEYILDF
ncbi:methyltransferase family protein [Algoriphagus ratkowskyi]|uniref:Class I SAM-dependent methyltransferase n=1 Tax=Algoriphagus ratkowskyi TaxID=57028 RepID=A0A2W7SC20_9BACT|nr:class I SAM-dependent methyltransferase [Algoriphagus ratkowskyi]PZX60415.1 methyltransferase family protein [Algoriphagus ratkowskyi]TXD78226.1 class I SAM-dependent methyltransferase [Algoriphagus ratkowskyi]